jgi:radical SAM protein with 4Fe4S-binding SPASM domain
MNEQPIIFHRSKKDLNPAHEATVGVSADGTLQFRSEDIITPKGLTKTNKLISILPSPEERVVTFAEATHLFQDIGHMNVILTNACNLSCSYCYEQHNKDYGRFTDESLLKAYNWLLDNSKAENRRFQFFGGEPLIHKDLILNFIDNNSQYLDKNYLTNGQSVSIITNGILLDKDFCKSYFEQDFTYMMISLDTLKIELDHRELKQEQIDKIISTVENLPRHAKERICFRCTLAQEHAEFFKEYMLKLYSIGIRTIIVHPLVHDSSTGFISWDPVLWDNLHKDIVWLIDEFADFEISFSEGVGQKVENNCLVGSDMIAIDGSGDFTGCYFFTNMKESDAVKPTVLGNIFQDRVHIDRYEIFQKMYNKMHTEEEQCKTCDYRNYCYQCPAGNVSTGTPLFRPDDMCQKIVKLYLDLQDDIKRKQKEREYRKLSQSL